MTGRRFAIAVAAAALVIAVLFGTIALRFMSAINSSHATLAATTGDSVRFPRLARRVVLVIFDGLRDDVSRELPFLSRLRAAGAHGTLLAPWPTLSRPNYVTILTGVEPRWSGVRDNEWHGTITLDSVPARVATTFVTDHRRRITLFGRTWTDSLPQSLGAGIEALVVVVPSALDRAGHVSGGTSDAYRAAARDVDRTLESMLDVDLTRDTIVIVADHGHTARGGHGGVGEEVTRVPLVLAGAGVRPGAIGRDGRLVDVAPTLAVLLGAPLPRHATGRVLVEALALSDAPAVASADHSRHSRLAPVLDWIAAGERTEYAWSRRWRLLATAAALLTWCAVAVSRRRGAKLDAGLVAASCVFPVAFALGLLLLPLGFSTPHVPGDTVSLVYELADYSAIAAVAQLIAWAAVLRRRADRVETAAAGLFVALVASGLPAAVAWAVCGEQLGILEQDPVLLLATPAAAVGAACHVALGVAVMGAVALRWRRDRRSAGG